MTKGQKYLEFLTGLFLISFAFNLFLAPYNFAAGGISGLALMIHQCFSINESLFIFIMNVILLFLSYLLLGKKATRNTIVGSLLFPIFIEITSHITSFIQLENLEYLVIAFLGGLLSGIGYGLIFKSGFTSGGTDILNQIIEKYFHIPISISILIIDGAITLLAGYIFGIQTMVYSMIALFFLSSFSNKKTLGIGENKNLYIYTLKYNEIKYYLHNELKIDSTDFEIIKGYSNENSHLILTVIKTKDYYRIKQEIEQIDSNVFITVTDAYQIINQNIAINMQ